MAKPLVRAAFAALVLATIAAFFVTQQLKGEFPLVIRFATGPADISPNGDGFRDSSRVGFDLSRAATVSFSIVDSEGNEVRRLVDDRHLPGDSHNRYTWNARDDEGRVVPDGEYTMRVVRRDEGRVINSIKKVDVDTAPPAVQLTSAKPGVISPGLPGQSPEVKIRYQGPRNEAPEFRIFRTDDGPPRVVARFRGDRSRSAIWHGTIRGRSAAEGSYAFTVTVRDKAGNRAVAPVDVPTAASARAGTGVAVRKLDLRGPLSVVPAGSLAHLEVGPIERSFDFALARLGTRQVLRKGGRIGGRFRVKIPEKAKTGVYVVRVRAGGRRAQWPIAVAGLPQTRRSARHPRPLVVLPALSWQGYNEVDDDLDGFPDTLAQRGGRVRLDRPLQGGGLPRGFGGQVSPLLRFLDREHLGYDLTTDLALEAKQGPSLGNAPGVAFAGSARWLPEGLQGRLRRYARDGGRVASFGVDAFRRPVPLRKGTAGPSARPSAANAFGERTRKLLRTDPPAPLVVEGEDQLGLFAGGDRFIGEFSLFEPSGGLPRDTQALTAAGRDPGEPDFVAYKLGKGTVVRAGTPQWAAELSEGRLGVEVPRAMKRIWVLLARGAGTG
jgi:FlgD Ig-like domain